MSKQVRQNFLIDMDGLSVEYIIERLKPLVGLGATQFNQSEYGNVVFFYYRDETDEEAEQRIRAKKIGSERDKESRQRMYEKLKKEFEE